LSIDPTTLEDRYVGTVAEAGGAMYQRAEERRTSDLGGGITVVETLRGFPGESTRVVLRQTVLRNGSTVFDSRYKTFDLSASPDHRYLLARNNANRLAPWRVYDLSAGTSVAVLVADSSVRLSPKFWRWSDDSRSILAAMDAFESETDANGRSTQGGTLLPYRRTFLVDPANGSFREQRHCQQADPKPDWAATPCAGPYL
jgi:hypothetical protein